MALLLFVVCVAVLSPVMVPIFPTGRMMGDIRVDGSDRRGELSSRTAPGVKEEEAFLRHFQQLSTPQSQSSPQNNEDFPTRRTRGVEEVEESSSSLRSSPSPLGLHRLPMEDLPEGVDVTCSGAQAPPASSSSPSTSSSPFSQFAVMTSTATVPTPALLHMAASHPHICFLVLAASETTASAFPSSSFHGMTPSEAPAPSDSAGSDPSSAHLRLVFISEAAMLGLPYRVVHATPLDNIARLNIGYLLAVHVGAEVVWDIAVEHHEALSGVTSQLRVDNRAGFFPTPSSNDVNLLQEMGHSPSSENFSSSHCGAPIRRPESPQPPPPQSQPAYYTQRGSVQIHHRGPGEQRYGASSSLQHCIPLVHQVWSYDEVSSPSRPSGSLSASLDFVLPNDVFLPHLTLATAHVRGALWALLLFPGMGELREALVWRNHITQWLHSFVLLQAEEYNNRTGGFSTMWASPCTRVTEVTAQAQSKCEEAEFNDRPSPRRSLSSVDSPSTTGALQRLIEASLPGTEDSLDGDLHKDRGAGRNQSLPHVGTRERRPGGLPFLRLWLKAHIRLYEGGLLDLTALTYAMDWMKDLGFLLSLPSPPQIPHSRMSPSSSSQVSSEVAQEESFTSVSSSISVFPHIASRQRSAAVCLQFNTPPQPRVLSRLLSIHLHLHEFLTVITPSPIHDVHLPARVHHIECVPKDIRLPLTAEQLRRRQESHPELGYNADSSFDLHLGNHGALQQICAAECFRYTTPPTPTAFIPLL